MANKLEIIVSNKEDAMTAEKGGADRLELSIRAEKGGLTPSLTQISDILINTKLPCYVVIRPNLVSYNLSDEEFKKMLHHIEIVKISKAKGISLGLLKDGKIDYQKLEKVIEIKGDLELIFNHAIDSTFDYETELKYLINNENIDWIETTGSAETIFDGYKRLIPFLNEIENKLMIGRAINVENIEMLKKAGFKNIVYQCKTSLLKEKKFNAGLSLRKIVEFKKELMK